MKHVAHLMGIAFVGVAFLLLMLGASTMVLMDNVIPAGDIDIEAWLADFQWWATWVIAASVLLSVVWYVLGQWLFGIEEWGGTNRRTAWTFLAFLALASSLLGIWLTHGAQEGALWAYTLHLLDGLGTFYLATALFSPSSLKYTAIGARSLRRWKLAF